MSVGAGLLTVVAMAGAGLVAPANAAPATLCASQGISAPGGAYRVNNDEWNSNAQECITTDGNTNLVVSHSEIDNPSNGAPGAYPDILDGCFYGACTQDKTLPITVGKIATATSDWTTTPPASGHQNSAYDTSYDIWFNRTPTTDRAPDGAELMIWLDHQGGVAPAGRKVGTATLDDATWDVWYRPGPGTPTISYVRQQPTTSVRGLDIRAIIDNAVGRGYIECSWYLLAVESGFEIWRDGVGLSTRSFSFEATKQGVSSCQSSPPTSIPVSSTTPTHPPAPVTSPVTPSTAPPSTPTDTGVTGGQVSIVPVGAPDTGDGSLATVIVN